MVIDRVNKKTKKDNPRPAIVLYYLLNLVNILISITLELFSIKFAYLAYLGFVVVDYIEGIDYTSNTFISGNVFADIGFSLWIYGTIVATTIQQKQRKQGKTNDKDRQYNYCIKTNNIQIKELIRIKDRKLIRIRENKGKNKKKK